MTQYEMDARRHEINYELQCRQHEAMKQYVEEKNKIERDGDGVKADYQAARELLEKSLDNLLKERIELKRRGLECFAPEMEDNYSPFAWSLWHDGWDIHARLPRHEPS